MIPLGIIHQILQPGEALLPYAIVGLVILLPSSWLPRWAVAVLGEVSLVPAVVFGGGFLLIPSMFLIGSALVRYGVVDRAENAPRARGVFFAVSAAIAIPTLILQARDITSSGFSIVSTVAGLALGGVYISLVLLALHTPIRGALAAVFAPLGRMALTNYIGATILMLIGGLILDLPHSTSWTATVLLAAGILIIQELLSALWLRHYTQGPLEYLWRWVTWGSRSPFLIRSAS